MTRFLPFPLKSKYGKDRNFRRRGNFGQKSKFEIWERLKFSQ